MKFRDFMQLAGMIAVLALAGSIIAGCGKASPKQAGAGPVVPVSERDFHIDAPTHLASGPVTLRISNEGPDEHAADHRPGQARRPAAAPRRADRR